MQCTIRQVSESKECSAAGTWAQHGACRHSMMRHTRQVPPIQCMHGANSLPSRLSRHSSLRPAQVTAVFNYARNLLDKYLVGRVIGAGSFGVVRECVERSSQRTYAVKTVPKASLHACAFPWIRTHARTHLHASTRP